MDNLRYYKRQKALMMMDHGLWVLISQNDRSLIRLEFIGLLETAHIRRRSLLQKYKQL